MTEKETGTCSCCKREGCSVTREGNIRHHLTDKQECQAGPDSRTCRGAGQPPAGASIPAQTTSGEGTATLTGGIWPEANLCRTCAQPKPLTANGRIRTHLSTAQPGPDGRVLNCAGGSEWPKGVDHQYDDGAGGVWMHPGPQAECLAPDCKAAAVLSGVPVAVTEPVSTTVHSNGQAEPTTAQHAVDESAMEMRAGHLDDIAAQAKAEGEYRLGTGAAALVCATQFSGGRSCAVGIQGHPGDCAPEDAYVDEQQREVEEVTASLPPLGPAPEGAPCDVCGHWTVNANEICDRKDCQAEGRVNAQAQCPGHRYEYGDDGNGHSGSFCTLCGALELFTPPVAQPEPPQDRRVLNAVPWSEVAAALAAFDPDNAQGGTALEDESSSVLRRAFRNGIREKLDSPPTAPLLPNGTPGFGHWFPGCGRMPFSREYADAARNTGDRMAFMIFAAAHVTGVDDCELCQTDRHVCPGCGVPINHFNPVCAKCSGRTEEAWPSRTASQGSSEPATTTTATQAPKPGPSSPQASPAPVKGASTTSIPATTSGPSKANGSTTTAPGRPSVADTTNDVASFLSGQSQRGEDELPRDRWGRYLLPHPASDRTQPWTRATTMAKSISDTYALSMWSTRMSIKGLTMRADLYALAGTLDVKQDRDAMNRLADEAKDAAGAKVAANLGTAVHAFTEHCDRAIGVEAKREALAKVPEAHQEDVQAYLAMLWETGLVPLPGLIEFTTVVVQFDVAGTSDRAYLVTKPLNLSIDGSTIRLEPGDVVIGDVKTGADLSYGWNEICIQLAIYAQGVNQAGVWDRENKRWYKPVHPETGLELNVRTDVGLVVHMPVDKTPAKAGQPLKPACTLYGIDLQQGWTATVLCHQVRQWRNRKNLAGPVAVVDSATPFTKQLAAEAGNPGTALDRLAEADISAQAASHRNNEAPVTGRAVRQPTWEERFSAVTTPREAADLWEKAKADLVSVGGPDELNRLVGLAQDKLRSLREPAG